MSDDLVQQLRALARYEHADHTLGTRAADEVERLRASHAALREGVEGLLAEQRWTPAECPETGAELPIDRPWLLARLEALLLDADAAGVLAAGGTDE